MSDTAMSETPTVRSFDVNVGTKRQFTIPTELYKQLGLKEGAPLRLTMHGETVHMEPLVSVPRRMISEELLAEMQSRRGNRANDVSLSEFLAWRRSQKKQKAASG
jgi:bifunctional DNA-binding transcriptional regulator/antitoxin component of YhaV-PrlF toxin-antitoxin module